MSPSRAPARTFQRWWRGRRRTSSFLRCTVIHPVFQRLRPTGWYRSCEGPRFQLRQTFAEGFKRAGRADKARMLNIAEGSLKECRYYLILAGDLNYGGSEDLLVQLDEVGRILAAYTKAILSPVS